MNSCRVDFKRPHSNKHVHCSDGLSLYRLLEQIPMDFTHSLRA
jgi:hypothetical protein